MNIHEVFTELKNRGGKGYATRGKQSFFQLTETRSILHWLKSGKSIHQIRGDFSIHDLLSKDWKIIETIHE